MEGMHDKVNIRRSSLLRLREHIGAGEYVAAMDMIDNMLDISGRERLRAARRRNYELLRSGEQGFDQYAENKRRLDELML